jgi:NAD(P)-dependent dehydrogenase (short-subunit alcohol dehydrogenase family)
MSSSAVPVVLLTGAGSGIGLTVLSKLLKDYSAKVAVLTLCPTPELTAIMDEYGPSRLVTVYGDACKVSSSQTFPVLRRSIFIKRQGNI